MFTIRRVGESIYEVQRYSDHLYTWTCIYLTVKEPFFLVFNTLLECFVHPLSN